MNQSPPTPPRIGDVLRANIGEALDAVELAIFSIENQFPPVRNERITQAEGQLRAAQLLLIEAQTSVGPDPNTEGAPDADV